MPEVIALLIVAGFWLLFRTRFKKRYRNWVLSELEWNRSSWTYEQEPTDTWLAKLRATSEE